MLVSGSQELLDYIGKGISIGQVRETVRSTKEFGIKAFGYFMLGLLRETPEMGRQTVQFARQLDLDFAQFTPVRPLPGTRLYELCKEEGVLLGCGNSFYDTSVSNSVLMPKINFIPFRYKNKKAVESILKFAYRKFYFSPSYFYNFLRRGGYQRSPKFFMRAFLILLRLTFSKLH